MRHAIKEHRFTIAAIAALIVLSIYSLFIGAIDITPSSLLSGDRLQVFFASRLPRLLAILCTGIGMSIAGLIMQQLTMNKFVSPSTGATIQSAQLGILISLVFFPSSTLLRRSIFAFAAAVIGTWIFVFFIQRVKFKGSVMVPLVGIMFGNVIGGFTNYFAYRFDLVQAMSTWTVGSFSTIVRGRYEIVYLVVPLVVVAFLFANHFNIIGMGRDFATNLGIPYNVVLILGLSISAIITASIVVTVGAISYVGLIVPNLVSMFKGDRLRGNLIDTALFGAVFVLLADVVGRIVIAPYEVPIELIIGILGSVIFIFFLLYRLGHGERSILTVFKENRQAARAVKEVK